MLDRRLSLLLTAALIATSQVLASTETGINVGQPKVFEERSLRAMLEAAEVQLERLGFLSQEPLTQAMGSLQGATRRHSALGLAVKPLPLPTHEVETTTKSTSVDGAALSPSELTVKEVAKGAAFTSSEALPLEATQGLDQKPASGFSISARDLLAEQLSLTYQIASLRLALERSFTDRVALGTTANGTSTSLSRPAFLLGIEASVSPHRRFANAVAEIEIVLSVPRQSACMSGKTHDENRRLSLMALLPQKNTYNVAAITQNIKHVGLGSIAGAFQIGLGGKNQVETFYHVQDADTVATMFERPEDDRLSFGWQMRPVLGRRSVNPGVRQFFAVLSAARQDSEERQLEIQVEVTTRWRRWHGSRQATGRVLAESTSRCSRIVAPMPKLLEESLSPKDIKVQWFDLGSDRALVTIRGSQLVRESSIILGDAVIDESSGLVIKGEDGMSFTTSLASLVAADRLAVAGRYGLPVELGEPGFACMAARFDPVVPEYAHDGSVLLTVSGSGFPTECRPLVLIGKTVYGSREHPFVEAPARCQGGSFRILLRAPLAEVRASGSMLVRQPFATGCSGRMGVALPSDFTASRVMTLGRKDGRVVLGVVGSGLGSQTRVRLGSSTVPPSSSHVPDSTADSSDSREQSREFVVIEADVSALQGVEHALVWKEGSPLPPVLVKIDPKLELPKPSFNGELKVAKGFARAAKIAGTDLDSIRATNGISFQGSPIASYRLVDGDSALEITFTDAITSSPGAKQFELTLLDGTRATLAFVVTAE